MFKGPNSHLGPRKKKKNLKQIYTLKIHTHNRQVYMYTQSHSRQMHTNMNTHVSTHAHKSPRTYTHVDTHIHGHKWLNRQWTS